MANIFTTLPTAIGNGVGAPVDVSAFGALKSIVCAGTADATINIEINNAAVNTDGGWQSIATFQGAGSINLNVAARWMRVRTTAYNVHVGGTTAVDVGGTDDTTTFAALTVPAGTGVGAAVDVSALPAFKTVQVGGAFRGTLIVEVSEDGLTEWAQPFSFLTPSAQSGVMAARWMRVRRVGVPSVNPGQPVVNVGAAAGAGGGGGGGVAISAGTQSVATGTVAFANSNGVTFGMSGSSRITASYSQSTGPSALSASGSSASSGTIVFSNSNGVTFGMSGNTITGSIGATTETPFGISAGTQSASTGTMVFSNSNGVSFGMSGSNTITASYSQSTAPAAISAGTELASSGTVVFSNSNGVSFGMSNGTVTGSVVTTPPETPFAISAGTQSVSTGTMVFVNSNGVSFGMAGSNEITASYTQSTGPAAISAGTTLAPSGTIVFSNSNGISFGLSGSTVTGSIAAGGFGGISAGTQSGGTGTIAFVNSNGVSFGMSDNSQVTASVASIEPLRTNSQIESNGFALTWGASHGTLSIQKATFGPLVLSATQAIMLLHMSQNTASTGAFTLSLGVYTLDAATANLASSASRAISWTSGSVASDTAQYAGVSGTRYRTIPVAFNFTAGDYLMVYHLQTANSASITLAGKVMNVAPGATFDGIETSQWMDGFSASSFLSGFPASIGVTDTNYLRTGGGVARMPGVIFQGSF